jgi:hypothetical protein
MCVPPSSTAQEFTYSIAQESPAEKEKSPRCGGLGEKLFEQNGFCEYIGGEHTCTPQSCGKGEDPMGWLFGGILNLVLCVVIGMWAGSKGRSSLGWFFISLITTPLIGAVALLIVGDKRTYLPYR